MQITRNGIDTQKGPADWFTGDVYIDAVAAAAGSSTFAAALVLFTPGARTAWHTHPYGQTIFVTEGAGRCRREGGPVEEIRPGEVAYARMPHDEVSERGVHVAHTAIGGRIAPGSDHEPDEVAEVLWQEHRDRSVFQTRIGIE